MHANGRKDRRPSSYIAGWLYTGCSIRRAQSLSPPGGPISSGDELRQGVARGRPISVTGPDVIARTTEINYRPSLVTRISTGSPARLARDVTTPDVRFPLVRFPANAARSARRARGPLPQAPTGKIDLARRVFPRDAALRRVTLRMMLTTRDRTFPERKRRHHPIPRLRHGFAEVRSSRGANARGYICDDPRRRGSTGTRSVRLRPSPSTAS